MPSAGTETSENKSWSSYLMIILIVVAAIFFVMNHFMGINFFGGPNDRRRDDDRNRVRPSRSRPQEYAGIREPHGRAFP